MDGHRLGLGPQLPPSIAAMLVRMQQDLEAVQMQPTNLAARFSISSHPLYRSLLPPTAQRTTFANDRLYCIFLEGGPGQRSGRRSPDPDG